MGHGRAGLMDHHTRTTRGALSASPTVTKIINRGAARNLTTRKDPGVTPANSHPTWAH